MKRKVALAALALAFVGSATVTALTHAYPCLKCKKQQACPPGYCYVDCVNCCYEDFNRGIVCFK